ncbi:hypothetical protein OE88DRAFT_1727436 [Heliocybe sulcata]|uniref:Uncharacterized protein n=1 Tax=Heliocybe sulcata TaxID=5364 RepID=A0A5C3MW20_9AGAM|nr:hypothetical protein OE88DRAFT_1727436 [Heliocybe sulcata]
MGAKHRTEETTSGSIRRAFYQRFFKAKRSSLASIVSPANTGSPKYLSMADVRSPGHAATRLRRNFQNLDLPLIHALLGNMHFTLYKGSWGSTDEAVEAGDVLAPEEIHARSKLVGLYLFVNATSRLPPSSSIVLLCESSHAKIARGRSYLYYSARLLGDLSGDKLSDLQGRASQPVNSFTSSNAPLHA